MDYIRTEASGQLSFTKSTDYLKIPSCLYEFHNTETTTALTESGRTLICFKGELSQDEEDVRYCNRCGCRMHINARPVVTLRHLNFGGNLTNLEFPHIQYRCSKPGCGATVSPYVSFKAPGHRITVELFQYVCDLLATGHYTNKEVAELTGLGKNVVKDIDKQRLKEKYTIDGTKLRKPEQTTDYLGIDEFKLHDNRRFATHIIDMRTGHILWIASGRKKQVVYDFIDHVGWDWMLSVKAVACDMNSDFEEAFRERCPHIHIVFDHFHITKHLNEAIGEIRKDEQRRLIEEGNHAAAASLKGSKYILTSRRSTLRRHDKEAADGKLIRKGSDLFGTEDVKQKGGLEERYNQLLQENALLCTVDIIKEKLYAAYHLTDKAKMKHEIQEIADICLYDVDNVHLKKFGRMLLSHMDGIYTHATYAISTGKIEGINNKIKTLRRQGYGYPDDEYFFLKLIDMSRVTYVRNPKSHRKSD